MRAFFALFLLAVSIWLVLPNRNEFGRAGDEELLSKCEVANTGTVFACIEPEEMVLETDCASQGLPILTSVLCLQ